MTRQKSSLPQQHSRASSAVSLFNLLVGVLLSAVCLLLEARERRLLLHVLPAVDGLIAPATTASRIRSSWTAISESGRPGLWNSDLATTTRTNSIGSHERPRLSQRNSNNSISMRRQQTPATKTTTTQLHMLPPLDSTTVGGLVATTTCTTSSLNSFLVAVPIFDGKSVVDPVVVSNAFWDGLTRQIVSLIIANILAVIGFGILSEIFKEKMIEMGKFVSENIFKGGSTSSSSQQALKQPPPGYQGGMSRAVEPDFNKLLLCIVIDTIGTSSELIPFVGEVTDLVWAPVAALLLRNIFFGSNVVFALEFAEEILLFTDILPLATICWVVDTYFYESQLARILQLGIYRTNQAAAPNSNTFVTTKRREQQQNSSLNEVVSKNAAPGKWRQLDADQNDSFR